MVHKPTYCFTTLSREHIETFVLYVRAFKCSNTRLTTLLENILMQNASQCKTNISELIPGSGFIIGNRFEASARAELLLLTEPLNAFKELQSCHKTVVLALTVRFGQKTKWKQLCAAQLAAMVEFVANDTPQTELTCLSASELLGSTLDSLFS
jgi:hypothetical protein